MVKGATKGDATAGREAESKLHVLFVRSLPALEACGEFKRSKNTIASRGEDVDSPLASPWRSMPHPSGPLGAADKKETEHVESFDTYVDGPLEDRRPQDLSFILRDL